MFEGCTSLERTPNILLMDSSPGKTLGNVAYNNMFKNCTALVDASNFKFYPPYEYVYAEHTGTFEGCTSL